ncbi:MAG TPA: phosphoribulokinase [Methanoregulaceae archaeon]|nr:phosphoribulokinase [Methanoregulaceae archaeon]HPD75633.1 phosphoribulokinase [Methanoregulaceae archaeon]
MKTSPNFKEIIANSPRIFTIGVAGDSGSGKTTFTNAIRQIFGPDLVATITLDDYHAYDRKGRRLRNITPLHPDANNLDRLESDISTLKSGHPIHKPVYNHRTGTFDPPVFFLPQKILILEGLHTLFTPGLCDLMDFSIYVDPDKEVKYAWKRKRDMEKRGYSSAEVIDEIARREKDYEEYIAPQRCHADAVIQIRHSKYGKNLGESRNIYQISLLQNRMRRSIAEIELSIDLHSLLSFHDADFLIEFSNQQIACEKMRALIFDGELNYATIRALEKTIEHQTGVHPIQMFEQRSSVTATDIIQLILSWRIIHRRIFLEENS